jgi:3-hydroxyisobutyrate dehydrogenase-like beta-hydroxyacid dehydrogenase
MGGPMALNLVKAGFKLVVHDIDQTKTAPLRAQGAELAATAEAVAAEVDRTIVIVENHRAGPIGDPGERGIIRSAKAGHIVLCMATIDPFAARALADKLASQGIAMLDAPVSGGTGAGAIGRAVGDRGRRRRRRLPSARICSASWAAARSMSVRWAAASP